MRRVRAHRAALLAFPAALAAFVAALVVVAAASAQQEPTIPTLPAETVTVTETETSTETATETATETETAESSERVDLESWEWALLAAGATAIVLIAFAVGRGTRGHPSPTAAAPPTARNQMLLAALSGWLAEGWTIESQSSTEAVVRKGTERRLLTVDDHGALNRSELPSVGADPTWVAPADDEAARQPDE